MSLGVEFGLRAELNNLSRGERQVGERELLGNVPALPNESHISSVYTILQREVERFSVYRRSAPFQPYGEEIGLQEDQVSNNRLRFCDATADCVRRMELDPKLRDENLGMLSVALGDWHTLQHDAMRRQIEVVIAASAR
jgi:hypothetical protein